MTNRRQVWKDFALYVSISVIIVSILVVAALSHLSEPLIMKWWGIFLFTGGIFGIFLEKFRKFWRVKRFWAWVGLLLVLHCVFLETALRHGKKFPELFWVFVIEAILLIQVTRSVFRNHPNRPAPPTEAD